MNLKEINTRLGKILEELKIKIPELEKAETKYWYRYYELILSEVVANLSTESKREAQAKGLLRQEGLTEKYYDLKLEVRMLLTEKEILFKMADNYRTLLTNKDLQGIISGNMNNEIEQLYIPPEEAARILGIQKRQVIRMIEAGKIRAIDINASKGERHIWRVLKEDILPKEVIQP